MTTIQGIPAANIQQMKWRQDTRALLPGTGRSSLSTDDIYYFNAEVGESSWERPSVVVAKAQPIP
jgi:hypothetical protein